LPCCQDIAKHSSSQFAKILRSAVCCLTSPEKHFAEVNLAAILRLSSALLIGLGEML
jgi:hypothetical protein